jgi:hypothetical protein
MVRAAASNRAGQDEAEPSSTAAAAERFVRAEHLDPGYSPWRHIGLTLTIACVIATLGVWLAAGAHPLDWLLMPVFWVFANFIEWAVHRYPMHRPMTPRILYVNHTKLHHMAFTDQKMTIGPARELGLIMMPWYTMIGLFAVASPVMLAAAGLRGRGLAGVFLLGAVAYFLGYELLHALYHVPDAKLNRIGIGRLGVFRAMQRHHRHHHILRRMTFVNFNVTVPLMDHLLGTHEREEV